jgi:hypothetical protein
VFLLLGAPRAEAMQAGGLFGTKIVLNEFVGFIDLQEAKGLSDHPSPSSPSRCAAAKLLVDRHPDGRDRRPGAQPAPGDRAPGHQGAVRRRSLQPDERGAGGLFLSL